MARTLKLEVVKRKNHNPRWTIRGLKDYCPLDKVEKPDTEFVLVGMYHSCDTPESVVSGVFRAIYDHHQVMDEPYGFQDGDVIESEPVTVSKFMSWDESYPQLQIPAMRMRVNSFHVILEEPDIETDYGSR